MNGTALKRHAVQGFAAITLRNKDVHATIIPALGARIVSLRSAAGTREWLWHPEDGRGLFVCAENTPFENSPLAGIDECLPSVLPCAVDGVPIPDHGEVWSRAWTCEVAEDTDRAVTTTIALRSLPLTFTRRVSLSRNVIHLDYTLLNTGARALSYLWALHPLFTLESKDEIELFGESGVVVTGAQGSVLSTGDRGSWPSPRLGSRLDRADTGPVAGGPEMSYCKAFLDSSRAAGIALVDRARGERLTLTVDPVELPAWGYWVTRGGWHGHTHIALEPSNAAADSLAELTKGAAASTLSAKASRSWSVKIKLDTDI